MKLLTPIPWLRVECGYEVRFSLQSFGTLFINMIGERKEVSLTSTSDQTQGPGVLEVTFKPVIATHLNHGLSTLGW